MHHIWYKHVCYLQGNNLHGQGKFKVAAQKYMLVCHYNFLLLSLLSYAGRLLDFTWPSCLMHSCKCINGSTKSYFPGSFYCWCLLLFIIFYDKVYFLHIFRRKTSSETCFLLKRGCCHWPVPLIDVMLFEDGAI